MEAVASREGPKGGLGVWIAASLLPVYPLFFTRLPEAACYSYQTPGPEVRGLMTMLIAGTVLSSFVALGLAFGRLRSLHFKRLPRFAVWPLALAGAVGAVGLALLCDPDSGLSSTVDWFFLLGIPLTALSFMGILVAWVLRWSPAETNQALAFYLLSVGAFGYPGLLFVTISTRGGAFC